MNDNVYRYLDDEMSPEERTAFEARLLTDHELALMVADMRAMMSLAATSSVTTPIPAALASSVLTTIAPSSVGVSTLPLLLSIVAGAGIIFGLGWWAGSSTAVTSADVAEVTTTSQPTSTFVTPTSTILSSSEAEQEIHGTITTTSTTDGRDASTRRVQTSDHRSMATTQRRQTTRQPSSQGGSTQDVNKHVSLSESDDVDVRLHDNDVRVTMIDRLSNATLTTDVHDVNTSMREQHRDVIEQKLLSITEREPGTEWYEDLDGTLRLASSITSATDSPLRPVTALERVSATVTYGLSNHHRLGLAVGSEVIPISYERYINGARFRIDQQGAVRWIGAVHRWIPMSTDVFQPWLETTLGAWTAGYVGKTHVGATFFISPAVGIALGVEATGITFRVDERNRAATTLGLTTAITVRPW